MDLLKNLQRIEHWITHQCHYCRRGSITTATPEHPRCYLAIDASMPRAAANRERMAEFCVNVGGDPQWTPDDPLRALPRACAHKVYTGGRPRMPKPHA